MQETNALAHTIYDQETVLHVFAVIHGKAESPLKGIFEPILLSQVLGATRSGIHLRVQPVSWRLVPTANYLVTMMTKPSR